MDEESPDGAKYDVAITNSSGMAIGDGAQVIQHIHMPAPGPELPPLVELERMPDTHGFVGRGAEMAYFADRVRNEHVAIIAGMPGVGKTWLATVLANETAGEDQIFWHRFHEGYRRGEGVETIIWRLAVFLAQHGQDNLRQRLAASPIPPFDILFDYLIDLLPGHGFLLCLDDFHLVDEDPWTVELTRRLMDLASSGGVSLIIVSRRMPAFAFDTEPLGGLSLEDTLDLLAARGQPLSAELAAELRARTGGNAHLLMLAINALQKCVEPADLLAKLAESDDIEQYLLAEVHKYLSEDERAVMRAVAVLLGYPGTRDCLEAILGARIRPETLNNLRQRYLLTVSRGAAGRAYGQHAILQAFYYGQSSEGELQELHRHAGEYYASKKKERDPLSAARHFERAEDYARSAAIITADVWVIINQGQAQALRQLLDELAEQEMEVGLSAQVHLGRGEVCRQLRESKEARESYARAYMLAAPLSGTPIMRELGARACQGMGELLREDTPEESLEWLARGLGIVAEDDRAEIGPLQAALLIQAGGAHISMGDFPAARNVLKQGLALLPVGPSQQRASGLSNLGMVLSQQGDVSGAVECYRQALEISEKRRDLWTAVGVRNNLAVEMETAGDWQGAAAEYQAALALAEKLGSRAHQADLELNLGFLATRQGEDAEALAHLSRCQSMANQGSLRLHLVYADTGLADLYLRQGKPEAAGPLLTEAERLANEIDARDRLPEIGLHRALWHLATGDIGAALSPAEAAAHLAHELEMPVEEGMSLRVRGQALRAATRLDDALAAFEQSHSLLANCDPYETARTQALWGSALVASGDVQKGRHLLREAQTTFTRLGARRDLAGVEGSLSEN